MEPDEAARLAEDQGSSYADQLCSGMHQRISPHLHCHFPISAGPQQHVCFISYRHSRRHKAKPPSRTLGNQRRRRDGAADEEVEAKDGRRQEAGGGEAIVAMTTAAMPSNKKEHL
jgi:hypothetical protein